jgi:predicted PurR-regulated permease PerM
VPPTTHQPGSDTTDSPSRRRDLLFWALVLGGLLVFLWLLADVLLPFVLGMAIAYVLDPVVVWLTRHHVSRATAAGLLVGGSFVVSVVAMLVVGPVVIEQAGRFLERVPDLLASAYRLAMPLLQHGLDRLGVSPRGEVPDALVQAGPRLTGILADWAAGLLGRGVALVNLLGLLSVTPLVAFYLLRDWPKVVTEVDGWLPRKHAEEIRALARDADRVLAGFARGAALVCASVAMFYAIALSLAGLDFGLLIGLVAGGLSFVPYLGALVGLSASVGMALIQFGPHWPRVALVAGIFVTGNVISDYVITPRVVGDRIGLHPLWLLFGVFAGGALFGFVGMLIAVPACAVIGVVARFAIGRYKASSYYGGEEP